MTPKVYPVIHYIDDMTTHHQVVMARAYGADGVFLISHHGDDHALLDIATHEMRNFPDFRIGVNLLSLSAKYSAKRAFELQLPMSWTDMPGNNSTGMEEPYGQALKDLYDTLPKGSLEVFASVAFKYQRPDPNPAEAARLALAAGYIPTTSGDATGHAPSLTKIKSMSEATGGVLAVASGMTIENVADYVPYVSHILVATGIELDEYHMDHKKLQRFLERVRS